MLTNVKIENFRSIENMELPLTNLNVVVGENDIDASVLSQAFLIGKLVATGTWKEYVHKIGWNNLLPVDKRGRDGEMSFMFTADFEKDTADYIVMLSEKNDSATAILAIMNKETGVRRMFDPNQKQNTGMTPREEEIRNTFLFDIQSWWIQGNPLKDSSNPLYVAEDGSNLGKVLAYLQTAYPTDYEDIVSSMKSVNPQLKQFLLNNGQVQWREKGSDFVYDEKMMSNGTRRYLMLMTLLRSPVVRPLIILENPEASLHPSAVHAVGAAIRLLSEGKTISSQSSQLLVSTQSEHLINEFEANNIIVATNERQHSYFERLDAKATEGFLNFDDGDTLGKLWANNTMAGACIHGPHERFNKWYAEQKDKDSGR
jgi:predicted ATPase